MSQLEPQGEDATGADEVESVTLSVDGGETLVTVPADASEDEAAAVAVALGAHITDRQRAAAAARVADATQPADPWRLVDRLELDRPDRWLDVEDGQEWRGAGRRY